MYGHFGPETSPQKGSTWNDQYKAQPDKAPISYQKPQESNCHLNEWDHTKWSDGFKKLLEAEAWQVFQVNLSSESGWCSFEIYW